MTSRIGDIGLAPSTIVVVFLAHVLGGEFKGVDVALHALLVVFHILSETQAFFFGVSEFLLSSQVGLLFF